MWIVEWQFIRKKTREKYQNGREWSRIPALYFHTRREAKHAVNDRTMLKGDIMNFREKKVLG